MIEYADPRKVPLPRTQRIRLFTLAASMIGWTFAAVFVTAGIGVLAGIVLTPLLGSIIGLGAVAGLIIITQCVRSVRRRRTGILLSYLEQAVRLNLPLPPFLQAASRGERGPIAQRVASLRAAIEDGSPLGDAPCHAAPEAPARIVELTNAAERNGKLRQTLCGLLRNQRRLGQANPAGAAFARVYAAVIIAGISMLVWALLIFVMPRFVQIMRNFNQPMPAVTRSVMGACACWHCPPAPSRDWQSCGCSATRHAT